MAKQRYLADWSRHTLQPLPLTGQKIRAFVGHAVRHFISLLPRYQRAWTSRVESSLVRLAVWLSPRRVVERQRATRPPRFGSSPPPRFALAPIPGGRYEKRLLNSPPHPLVDVDAADDEPTIIDTFIAPNAQIIREERA